jgi:hypothetical protein
MYSRFLIILCVRQCSHEQKFSSTKKQFVVRGDRTQNNDLPPLESEQSALVRQSVICSSIKLDFNHLYYMGLRTQTRMYNFF